MEKIPKKNLTEETYDKAAEGYAKKFENIGVRSKDVDQAFEYISKENPNVLEIGCGGGREAAYILSKTDNYIGIDVSAGMLAQAQENLPDAQFQKTAVETYDFPTNVDIVFAFASLLHTSKEDLKDVFERMYEALNESGVVYLSLKRKDKYSTTVVEDSYGPREFFYYSRDDIHEVAGEGFEEVFYEEQAREEDWFTMILRKK